jgi:hypothetical protein
MRTMVYIFSLVVFLGLVSNSDAVEFTWEAGNVSAKVVVDTDILKIGQYLYITHDDGGREEWNMAKLDLPESWKMKSVKVDGKAILVTTESHGRFRITPENLGALRKELLKNKREVTEEKLQEIWRAVEVIDNRRGI